MIPAFKVCGGLMAMALLGAPTAAELRWNSSIPPARFQGPGGAPVFFVPAERIKGLCAPDAPDDVTVFACTGTVEGHRVIIMPLPCPHADLGEFFARIMCHELAHHSYQWRHEAL